MFCSKCGNKIKDNYNFCQNCGNNLTSNNYQNINNNNSQKNSNGLAIASLVIGIIAIILSFSINIFILPLAITGLILGIVNKNKCGQKIAGIILNSLSMVIAIITLIIVAFIIGTLDDIWEEDFNTNPVIGVWNCKSFDGSAVSNDYIITMKMNDNGSFIWSKYGDDYNNYVYGSYNYLDLEKTNNSGDYEYYTIELYGEEIVSDGVIQTQEYNSEYEMGINEEYDEAILMNVYTYNMYYCYLEY